MLSWEDSSFSWQQLSVYLQSDVLIGHRKEELKIGEKKIKNTRLGLEVTVLEYLYSYIICHYSLAAPEGTTE